MTEIVIVYDNTSTDVVFEDNTATVDTTSQEVLVPIATGESNRDLETLQNVDATNLQTGSLLIYNTNTAKWMADINLTAQNMDAGEF